MNALEVILHPVRYKVIQLLLDEKKWTAKALIDKLQGVAQATLYRQLDILVRNGVLIVVEENKVRGAIEKKYKIDMKALSISPTSVTSLSKTEHLKHFLFFTTELTKNFQDYLKRENIHLQEDGVGYRQDYFFLSTQELHEFKKEIQELFEKYQSLSQDGKRRKHSVSTVFLPIDEKRGSD